MTADIKDNKWILRKVNFSQILKYLTEQISST